MSGSMKCRVIGCGDAEMADHDGRWDFCEVHNEQWEESPELRRCRFSKSGSLARWRTASADFARRVSLESQRDRETREGEQR